MRRTGTLDAWWLLATLAACGSTAQGGGATWQEVPAGTPGAGMAPAPSPTETDPLPTAPLPTTTGTPTMEPPPVIEPPPAVEPPPVVEPPMAGSDAPPVGNPDDPLDSLRQACVDHINMYRSTLGLTPLVRATPEQEACSDVGAKSDSEIYASTGQAHQSAGDCAGLGAQNTCPGWPLWGGATIEGTMKQCLDSMWDEGEPPVPVSQCIQQYQTCFLMYGHYINMSSPEAQTVACGFYEMPDGSWWMNQNFGG